MPRSSTSTSCKRWPKRPRPTKWVVVAAEPVTDIDITAADALSELDDESAAGGHRTVLCRNERPGERSPQAIWPVHQTRRRISSSPPSARRSIATWRRIRWSGRIGMRKLGLGLPGEVQRLAGGCLEREAAKIHEAPNAVREARSPRRSRAAMETSRLRGVSGLRAPNTPSAAKPLITPRPGGEVFRPQHDTLPRTHFLEADLL